MGWGPLTQAPASGLVYLTAGTASNVAQIDFVLTGYTAYRGFRFIFTSLIPATDNTFFQCRFSTNAGSSYDAGASDYQYEIRYDYQAGTFMEGSANDTKISLVGYIGNGSSEGVHVIADLLNPFNSALATRISAEGNSWEAGNSLYHCYSAGHRKTAQDTDAIRFLMSSGNISSAGYVLYGYA